MCLKGDKPEEEKPTAVEQQQIDQARAQWETYKSTYVPLEAAQMQRIEELRSVGERQQNVANTVSEAKGQIGAHSLQPGESSGSASQVRRALALEAATGDTVAGAIMQAEEGQAERYERGRQRIIDFGLGKASTAAMMTGRTAQMGAASQAINNASQNSMNNFNSGVKQEMYGFGAGTAAALAPSVIEGVQNWGGARRATTLDRNQYNTSYGGNMPEANARMA